ncbi:hypothetical protein [Nocardia sp. NPDC057353]|uniref:hypothetical protein n=1 Tax=Nocardia sp. NPDC057353 TaxID=3346104 RepID=UPI003634B309
MAASDRRRYDCDQDPVQLSEHTALLILRLHDHEPTCGPLLAALAFLSNPQAFEYE